jgi:predicted nucleotide-binding protein
MIIVKQRAAAEPSAAPKRRVFLVHGRNLKAKNAVVDLLRAFDLRVISWDEASAQTGMGTPYTGDVVIAGMQDADAVVVLLTPDDVGCTSPDFVQPGDAKEERTPGPQARLNVVFEAGMAMALNRQATVLVEVGRVRPMSDTAGLNVVRVTSGTIPERLQLANRLQTAGLAVDVTGHTGWATAGDFTILTATGNDGLPSS